jgi:hypothetical protein
MAVENWPVGWFFCKLLSPKWLITSHPNMRFLLESTAAQRVCVSQQARIMHIHRSTEFWLGLEW